MQKMNSLWVTVLAGALSGALLLTLQSCSAAHAGAVDEQQWIENKIGKDIFGMVLFAANKRGPAGISLDSIHFECEKAGSGFQYTMKWQRAKEPETQTISLFPKPYIWNPDSYAPYAVQFLKHFDLRPEADINSAASQTDATIRDLSTCETESIEKQNQRLTKELSTRPLDPALHEQAALLCSVMALREFAGSFNDTRGWLNRTTAHLAVARALRASGEFGDAGQLAHLTLLTLSGRTEELMTRTESMLATDKNQAFKSYVRALRLRATSDVRQANLKNATAVEDLAYAWALFDTTGVDDMTDFIEKEKPPVEPINLSRIGTHGESVAAGHLYSESAVAAELENFSKDAGLFGVKITRENRVAELNRTATECLVHEPGKDWQLEPVSWDTMSAFHCRELLHSYFTQHYFESQRWGVPEKAAETQHQFDSHFSDLTLHPICKGLMICTDQISNEPKKSIFNSVDLGPKLTEEIKDVVTAHPELCTFWAWNHLQQRAKLKDKIAPTEEFYKPALLPGTTYDTTGRWNAMFDQLQLSEWEEMRDLNPYNYTIRRKIGDKKWGDKATPQQMLENYGPLCEYSVNAMQDVYWTAEQNSDWDLEEKMLLKIAQLKASYYFTLGDFYVNRNNPSKATTAFETAISKCHDSVTVSNNCVWLAHHYFDIGEKGKAMKLAQMAGDVYSQTGLSLLGWMYDRTGEMAKAEETFKNEQARYENSSDDLCQFYIKHRTENARYQEEADRLLKIIYQTDTPARADDSSVKGSPKTGARITTETELTKKYGIRRGDVAVAIEGYRINNVKQYLFIRQSNFRDPNFSITLWDGSQYRTVHATAPERRLGCEMDDYTDGKPLPQPKDEPSQK